MSQTIGYKKSWYKEWFGEEYLTVYQHRDDKDARRLIELIHRNIQINPDSYLLDLACGNGRHSFLLSKFNRNVVGLDLSAHLLNEAQKRKINHESPAFVRADMRYFPFNIKFEVIFSLFTSFGYFDDDEKHFKVAAEISDSLKDDGWFVIDYFNPDYVKANLVSSGHRMIENYEIFEERWISNGRVHKLIHLHSSEGEKKFIESVKMFEHDELVSLLGKAGIAAKKTFGNYSGESYSKSSKRMIIFAKKEINES
ncbi:MAG: class I SAM-dependent methyltransferase [Calditrichaeota bacterium]|nr:class I SAM-dependent methyltransferase [Calditrichota bacterium]